jgi:hypothetical protein
VLGEDWSAVHVALGRIALGALFLLAVLGVRRDRLPRGRRVWGHLAVVALLMNAVPFTLFAYGETKVSSILAGLWNATTPLMVLVVVLTLMREERPTRRALGGLAGGFAGVLLLLGPWKEPGRRRAARPPGLPGRRRVLRHGRPVHPPTPVRAPGGRGAARGRPAGLRDGDAARRRPVRGPPDDRAGGRRRDEPAGPRGSWAAGWRTS